MRKEHRELFIRKGSKDGQETKTKLNRAISSRRSNRSIIDIWCK